MTKIAVLRVVSKAASFRRAGFQFSAEATDIHLTDLTKVQRAAIEGDSALVAYEVEVEVAESTGEVAKPAVKSGASAKK
ncbi:hypothetical protein [Undibacterium sp. Xuan67W]|uniref:hypothetical protein n=1 Tax=Undibacterium sp. Xuan67W TaxID=3413057 RepID=UPI003BF1582F